MPGEKAGALRPPPLVTEPMPPPGTAPAATGVGPLTSVVTGSPSGGGAFLSGTIPFPLPARADDATARAATSVVSSSA